LFVSHKNITIFTDGASKGNPGISSVGYVIKAENGFLIDEDGFYIGITTNNHAEILAILISILNVVKFEPNDINLFSDSLLLIKQINKEYRIKNEILLNCHLELNKILKLNKIKLFATHIDREKNKRADFLANRGINEKKKLSKEIFDYLISNKCI
jgi:ribonuclease HI